MANLLQIKESIQRGAAALRAGQFENAIKHLRRALSSDANNPEALFYFASSLAATGDLNKAATTAAKSYRARPTFGAATLAADVAFGRKQWDDAKMWLTRALDHKPEDLAVLLRLGDMHNNRKLQKTAAEYYERALKVQPDEFEYLRRYCYCAATQDLNLPIAALEAYIARNGENPERLTRSFWTLLPHKEKVLRQAQGLSERAASFDDRHFRFATSELARWRKAASDWYAEDPANIEPTMMMALVSIANRDITTAERYLAQARPLLKDDPHVAAHFGSVFFDKVNHLASNPAATLPSVETLIAGAIAHTSVFAASDPAYFEIYGWPFVRTFARHKPEAHLRLHIFDLLDSERPAFLARLATELEGCSYSVTAEVTGLRGQKPAAPAYYHTMRFARAAAFVSTAPGAVCLTDMDMIFVHSADTLFSDLDKTDGQLMPLAGRVELSNQIMAGLMILAPSPRARDYLNRVAGYLVALRDEGHLVWGADQVALFAVYEEMARRDAAPHFECVPKNIFDLDLPPDAVLWSQKCDAEDPGFERHRATMTALGIFSGR